MWTIFTWRFFKKATSVFLLLVIIVGDVAFLAMPLHELFAAQSTIDADAISTQLRHVMLGSQSVFVSDQVGYKFYVDTSGICVYSKTTNGGTTWGTAVTVDSQTDCFGVSVWYDKWTPGDNGNYIHILTAGDTDEDLWYNRLDTTDDSRLLNISPISTVVNTGQGGTIAGGANTGSITKGTDGTLYMAMNDASDRYVVECSSNCGVTTSWTETGTTPMDLQPDFSMLLPLANGDILLINRDVSAEDMRSKVWNNTTGAWSATWTNIDATPLDNGTYDPGFAATVDVDTGDIYLAYIDWATTGVVGGNNDDIRTAVYSGGAWTLKTDVITNTTMGLTGVSIALDGNTDDVYVAYTAQTTAGTAGTGRVYWKSSTDGMTIWGAQSAAVNTTAEDIYGVDLNFFSYERLFVSWYGDTSLDVLGDTIANLTPTTVVSTNGIQTTEVRASTNNFYTGGSFVISENVTSRNVTSITVNEKGTVNASTILDNIKLYYDLDTSAPYNCASETYGGSETQFGSTDTDGFSAADGSSTFTGSVGISATQAMCIYTVLDVAKAALDGTTLELEISNPMTDVVLSGGVTPIPYYSQLITGETLIKPDTDFRIQRGVSTITGDTLTITAGVEYEAPVSSSSAFIRITNTQITGAGRDSGGGTSNADDTTVRITNPENITSSITFARGVGAVNNTRVAWEIIEYKGVAGGDNEMIVRKHDVLTYVSGNTTVTGAAVPNIVTDADVAVFITSQYNPDTGATTFHRGASTAAWDNAGNTVTLTRGASGSTVITSYAVVEFTGSNWKVQRIQHAYTAVGTTQTEAMTAVNSLSRAFVHVQKRFPSSTHANMGHEVWLSGIGQVSFLLDAAAVTPTSHFSVAWVIENTQTLGTPMIVTRSNGSFNTTGTAPQTNNVSIGKTLSDLSIASLFVNNRSDTTGNTWPEPIMSARLISTTQYELWRSDIGATQNYRTEVVEWPTAERKFKQNYYRLYVDNNSLLPTDPWPAGAVDLGENEEMTGLDEPLAPNDTVRIRMSVEVSGAAMPASADTFALQFAEKVTTCSAVTSWYPVGEIGSTTAIWRGINNTPADGTSLSTDPPAGGDLLINSVSTVAGTYEEQNPSAVNPFTAFPGDDVEYDWVVQHNGAKDKTSYCFRMIEDNGTLFKEYGSNYPTIRTVGYEPVITNWRWYDDETNFTPSTPLASENVAPIEVANQNAVKLRLVLSEISGAAGLNTKFAVQFSEYADFSQSVATVTATSSCAANSLWCYYNGSGVDNAQISATVISDADICGSGGCGTYNEGISASGATVDQSAYDKTEFEFTLVQAGARANAVYYFRLYDVVNNEFINASTSFPSLVAEGPQLISSISGVDAGQTIAGIVTDATTTAATIGFGTIPFNTSFEAAQRININTNATEGYQLLMYARQQLTNSYGDTIPSITSTNLVPAGWATACTLVATGCVGYHSTDATLRNASARFAPTDSYAAFDTAPREIMYSSIPANDTHDIVYRIMVSEDQVAGDYETDIVYISVPVF